MDYLRPGDDRMAFCRASGNRVTWALLVSESVSHRYDVGILSLKFLRESTRGVLRGGKRSGACPYTAKRGHVSSYTKKGATLRDGMRG